MGRKLLSTGLGIAVVAGGLLTAAPANAAQGTETLQCGNTTYTIRTNNNHSSDKGGWSVAQIVGDGHLIPTSFSFSAYDVTQQMPLFSFTQQKGGGNANQNQQTVSCTQEMDGTLGDLLEPGDPLPPGTSLDDHVTATFTATAVLMS